VPAEPIVRKNTTPLEKSHVRNFLDSVKSRHLPNSDVVSGHRSALASHLGKTAYIQKRRITFNPASEKDHILLARTDQKTPVKTADSSK
jgi:hypothetical protein